MGLDNGYGLGIGSLKPGVCTSSTRPTSAYDGQMIYETDTNLVRIWNGSAWKTLSFSDYTAGTVLQTVSSKVTQGFISSTSATFADVNLSATITPKSTSSTILIYMTCSIYNNTAGTGAGLRILRDSTVLQTHIDMSFNSAGGGLSNPTLTELDSPATTSAVTYKLQMSRSSGSGTSYIYVNNNPSTITLQEIAG